MAAFPVLGVHVDPLQQSLLQGAGQALSRV